MSENPTTKVPCIICGVPILRETAIGTTGLCMPCFNGCCRNSNPSWYYRSTGFGMAAICLVIVLLCAVVLFAVPLQLWSIGLLIFMGKAFMLGVLGIFVGTYLFITGRGK